ncbi:DUF3987 domain-containing protein [Belnapia sp. T6]|uniref:DUF3987 domain-containing protein n=1 Tax=Belnapia mucosa TaxID=2804532 RepID=A0ABS1VDM6_9PROT|nr:DUF3987 domain-containing protein [Belnapia mucosa]MBL6459397.1 DUF3987 domain-containing protein [Belnapia mucosa]
MNAPTGMSQDLSRASATAVVSALDRPFSVTFFGNAAAKSKREERFTLRSLASRVRTVTAPAKARLPWLKLARFGELKSDKNSLRHDANVLAISGIEGDYDGEKAPVATAVEKLTKAGVLAMVYTSPSHTEATPRWRVLCPTSGELPPQDRAKLLGRLNGLLEGVLSVESWTLSQGYYFGSIGSKPSHQVELVDGTPIDLLDDLDEIWRGKPQTGAAAPSGDVPCHSGPVDPMALLADITAGRSYHTSAVRLLGKWARDGVPYMEARARLIAAMNTVPEPDRDARWQTRRDDIDRCLDDIYGKEAKARDEGRRPTPSGAAEPTGQPGGDGEPWPDPVDFLADDSLTGPPELRPDHLPEALQGFVAGTAARMGVDPVSVALAALAACASVADDTWRIQPKARDHTWTEDPRLWGAIVGDPSILKTPVIRACTAPIDALDAQARHRHAAEMRAFKVAHANWKREGGDAASEPRSPRLDRYLVENATVEALSEVLRDDAEAKQRAPAGKVLVRQDEMAEFFANLDRYRTGGRGGGDRGAYLRLYNGGPWVVDRIGRGSFAIPNWSACFLGGIQPGPIQRMAREADDDGLLQRFLYCVPGSQAEGEDRIPDAAALGRYEALFAALVALRPAGSGSGRVLEAVVLHADAHRHREALLRLTRALAAMPDTSPRLRASLGKWPGLFARLALVFHLIDCADAKARGAGQPAAMVVSEHVARRAAALMQDVLLPHLIRADALMFSTAQTGHARWIAGLILAREQPRVTLRDVVQAYGALRAPEARRELYNVMEGLVTVGWLRPEPQVNPARPPSAWQVNPTVHTVFAERARRKRELRRQAQQETRETIKRQRQEGG